MFSFSNRSISSSWNLILSEASSLLLGTGVLIKVEEYERIMEEFPMESLFPMNPMNGGERGKEVVALTTCAADSFSS